MGAGLAAAGLLGVGVAAAGLAAGAAGLAAGAAGLAAGVCGFAATTAGAAGFPDFCAAATLCVNEALDLELADEMSLELGSMREAALACAATESC